MKIQYIGFKNIMGIRELEFMPGKVTLVEGKNGRGKTSVLRGIQASIGGGHDATLLTEGEQKGEIVVVFDDGMRLEKKIKRHKSDLKLKDVKGKDIPRAASFLKDIVDDIAVNPIKILTAKTQDRVKLLLDSVPMKIPFADLEAITGQKLKRDDERHPMQVISELRNSVYEDRKDNNRYLKERKTMVDQMRETLPFKSDQADYGAEIKILTEEKSKLVDEVLKVKNAGAEFLKNIEETLRAERDKAIEEAHADYTASLAKAHEEAEKDQVEVEQKNDPKIDKITEKLGELSSLKEESTRVASSIKYVKEGDEEVRKLEAESEELTETINALDDIKANLLTNLPFDGLEVRDGEIYLDGVAFDNVNKAKRVQFALAVAALRTAELPIVCVDNLEALDEESFAIFQDLAAKTDMQFFVTRVSQDPELQVKTDEA